MRELIDRNDTGITAQTAEDIVKPTITILAPSPIGEGNTFNVSSAEPTSHHTTPISKPPTFTKTEASY